MQDEGPEAVACTADLANADLKNFRVTTPPLRENPR
jgi:hypothetical protein